VRSIHPGNCGRTAAEFRATGRHLANELRADPGEPLHDCWRGYASESFYWPTGSTDGGMNRAGCFINELGFANLRYVWGRSMVYVGVLGNNGDIGALKAWSWYDEAGGEPLFGGPGVCEPAP